MPSILRGRGSSACLPPYVFAACVLTLAVAGAGAQPAPAEDVRALIAAAGTAQDNAGADLVAVFDRTETTVEASGLAHVVNRRLVKVLSEAGARELAFQRFDYDPVTQLIEIRVVRVHRAGGGVTDVDPLGAVDTTQPMHAIYWGARMRCVQLPRLAVGDAVELETYRKGFMLAYLGAGDAPAGDAPAGDAPDEGRYIPPMRGHWYDVQLFADRYPMREKSVTVRTPRDKPLQFRIYNDAVFAETTYDEDGLCYRFWRHDCPTAVSEWRTGDRQDYVAKVVMATVENWQAKSRWFWEVNQRQFDSTPEIDAVVARVTRGLETDEEKVHALNHWAAQNIRYCGLNMGEGEGYVLHPGDMILRERSGVCKDIAGMAITLCRAAGYEVYPAMTMAGARVERIPADQFNHCVGAWKKPDGTWHLIDPTWIPFSRYDWSRSEGEQHYVIGTPWGEDLANIRAYTPQENHATLELRGRIERDGAVVASLAVVGDGEADTRLRRTLGQSVLADREDGLRAWLANLAPDAELTAWRMGDPEDWSKPMTLSLEFRLPGYASVGERVCTWRPVTAGLALAGYGGAIRLAAPPTLPEDRETPAMLWWPQAVVLDERLDLPKGFEPRLDDAAWTAGGDGDFAACDLRAEADGRTVTYRGTFRYDRREVPVDDWPALRAAVNTFQDAGEARLVARRKGA
ncbi:MAG TPA: DUF3857 and transglutaminase domain-containing protein [Candidatus Krumholzibacteria bacterium]|nr:DUF3857 and transglutaminase domain-containing protein [Candidatus Krumholzibacteria bacterium]HPD72457.1 DUF3857 and transglutaminase domain-containing protein [Candidatus Krumholzibacteria bacterium]HRY40611.1 DUF3857 and transglutaminase domain-containing protein [Candidatus Krumholzibacteria bacterium]